MYANWTRGYYSFLRGRKLLRTAVSLGGDCDTLTAIAGSIAQGYYGIPRNLQEECYNRIPDELRKVVEAFENFIKK